jgi:catechol 2,3-dioxygenase-like lactoylglutathione lyase family enzyme
MLGSNDVCATVAVSDMAVATQFYGETLGLEMGDESPAGTFFKSGNSGIFVYPSGVAGTNKATYVAWAVDDVEGTIAELKAKGVNFEQYDNLPDTTREGDLHIMGDLKAAWFTDPDGNILSFSNMPTNK